MYHKRVVKKGILFGKCNPKIIHSNFPHAILCLYFIKGDAMKHIRPMLFFITLLVLVSLACSTLSGGSAPTDEPAQPATEPAVEPSNNNQGGSINSVDNVKDATIQIEAQGTFVDPEFGLQLNSAGRGSGFIIDPSGIAVTNNHVVAGSALVKVWLGGESSPRNAKVLGLSECSDLAVIQIEDGGNYPALSWYNNEVKPGLEIYAAGFPLGEPEYNLTKGIVSKVNASGETNWASVESVLGHDATINPGNSGGPLVTENGEVVGVNYRGRPDANQYFAIPSDIALSIISELQAGNDVDSIGVNGTAVLSEDGSLSGIWASSVTSGSPADKAGIQPGDIIYQLEGLVLATDGTMKDYCDVIRSHSPTDTMSLSVIRYATGELLEGQLNGRELEVTGNFDTGGGGGTTTTGGGGEPQAFFTEEFEADYNPDNWQYFTLGNGSDSDLVIEQEDDHLLFDLGDEDLYVYFMYTPYVYEDVSLTLNAENRGRNNNNVSLVCRMNEDGSQWYEFSVESGGVWYLYAVDGKYNILDNGGTNALKQGKEVNEYRMDCSGDEITLYINGTELKTVKDTTYSFNEGAVGFNISSLNVLPITVEANWFDITQP
jgi:serine protease Do